MSLSDYLPSVFSTAQQDGVNPYIAGGIMSTESSGNPNAYSSAGAIGLFQLIPSTAAQMGVNPWDPQQNIQGGIGYFSSLLNKFNGDYKAALASYNGWHIGINPDGSFHIPSGASTYINNVIKGAEKLGTDPSGFVADLAGGIANSIIPGSGGVISGALGGDGESWFQQLKDWITNSGFFERIALAVLALLFVLGGLYLLKGQS